MISRCRSGWLRKAVLVACLTFVAVGSGWAGDADHFRPGPSLGLSGVVTRDTEASSGDLVARARGGKIIVRNRSPFDADVHLGLDEFSLSYVNTVPSGFKLTIRRVPRRSNYVLYAEDETGTWGPRFFFLRKKYIWTLLGPA